MNGSMIFFITIFTVIYGILNYYIGIRAWTALHHLLPNVRPLWFWLTLGMLAIFYPGGRFIESVAPTVGNFLIIIGSYWLAAFYYLLLLTLLADAIFFLGRLSGLFKINNRALPEILVICLTLTLVLYGIWNARMPVVRNYEVQIPKTAGTLTELHIVMVSDIHLGKIVDTPRLLSLVNQINELNPDIILFAGDTIDEDVDLFIEKKMSEVLQKLQPPYGMYAVLGNHEYIGGKPQLAREQLNLGGVKVLSDEFILVNNSFYIVGRDDPSRLNFSGTPRQELAAIMQNIDRNRPIFLIDHQPLSLQEAADQGVDLQLSGHTHHGQFFLNSLVTGRIYELDWGYLRKNSLQVIVSCGYGTWGPPIRIGSQPEIISVHVTFSPATE